MPKTLGERCVDWCLARAAEEPLPSLETLALWFAHSEREGKRLGLEGIVRRGTRLNHCAAAQCAAALECAYEGDVIPHRPRAAAKELMADAIEVEAWHPIEEVLEGLWFPKPGDLAIYDRFDPTNPKSEPWHGHVDRTIRTIDRDNFECIGANEVQGRWRGEVERFDNRKLLGFIAYPQPRPELPKKDISDAAKRHYRGLIALTQEQAEHDYWESWHRAS